MLSLDALRRMPKTLLRNLYDTAGVLAYDDVKALESIEPALASLEPDHPLHAEAARLRERIDHHGEWQMRLRIAQHEQRPVLARVFIDDELDWLGSP